MQWHEHMEAHMDGRMVWLAPKAKLIKILGDTLEDGYAKVQRVQTTKMETFQAT